MTTITKTPKSKPFAGSKIFTFSAMIAHIHFYFKLISKLQSRTPGLTRSDIFHMSHDKFPGVDIRTFTGDKYTIEITIRENS